MKYRLNGLNYTIKNFTQRQILEMAKYVTLFKNIPNKSK